MNIYAESAIIIVLTLSLLLSNVLFTYIGISILIATVLIIGIYNEVKEINKGE